MSILIISVILNVVDIFVYLASQDAMVNSFIVGRVKISLDETKVTPDGKPVANPIAEFANIYHWEKPKTGDNSQLTFWFVMMLASGTACVLLIILETKYWKKKEL